MKVRCLASKLKVNEIAHPAEFAVLMYTANKTAAKSILANGWSIMKYLAYVCSSASTNEVKLLYFVHHFYIKRAHVTSQE